jgi:hypothetical protein
MSLERIKKHINKLPRDVAIENVDASGPHDLSLYRDPDVSRVVRRYVCDYEHCGAYRPHLSILAGESPPDPVLSRDEWNKVVPGPCFGAAQRMKDWLKVQWLDDRDRNIPVFFAGQVDVYPERISPYCESMLGADGATVHSGPPLKKHAYQDAMLRSKIALCPWGNGEMTYRLYEAWHSGAVPVMPCTDWITTWFGRLTAGRHYIPCKADGSDVDSVCREVLSNWTAYDAMRKCNYDLARDLTTGDMVKGWADRNLHGLGDYEPEPISVGWPDNVPAAKRHDHGWLCGDTKALLSEALNDRTSTVVEVGSWLGRSARFILKHAPSAHLYCIDTWQGSDEHKGHAEWSRMLSTLYETFLANMWDAKDRITPIRGRSQNGLRYLAEQGVEPDLVYVDGDHSEQAVYQDLSTAHRLFPSARLVGDDWSWRSVRCRVSGFLAENG